MTGSCDEMVAIVVVVVGGEAALVKERGGAGH